MSLTLSFPKLIPSYQEEIPLFRVSKYTTYSPRIPEVRADFERRVEQCKDRFRISGNAEDLGTKVVIQDRSKVLEIYRPSNSLWLTDKEFAYREKISENVTLPDAEAAKEIALEYLANLELDMRYANVDSIKRNHAITSLNGEGNPNDLVTEVHVNFSFKIGDYPIFGPGAKIKVSIVEEGRISNLIYFWREPSEDRYIRINHPIEALETFKDSSEFAKLNAEQAQVSLDRMRFGYYASPPFDFQRFLIPVYELKGVEETPLLGMRDVTNYIPATSFSAEVIRTMGLVDQPDIRRVIANTK